MTFVDDRMCICRVFCVCFGFETFVGDRMCCMYVRVWMCTTVWICLACSSETGYIPCHCTPLGTGAVLVTTPLKRPGMRRGRSYSRIWREDSKGVRPRWGRGGIPCDLCQNCDLWLRHNYKCSRLCNLNLLSLTWLKCVKINKTCSDSCTTVPGRTQFTFTSRVDGT